jgi:hypothetical protein
VCCCKHSKDRKNGRGGSAYQRVCTILFKQSLCAPLTRIFTKTIERDLESVLDYNVKMVNQIRFRPITASVGVDAEAQLVEALHYKSEG